MVGSSIRTTERSRRDGTAKRLLVSFAASVVLAWICGVGLLAFHSSYKRRIDPIRPYRVRARRAVAKAMETYFLPGKLCLSTVEGWQRGPAGLASGLVVFVGGTTLFWTFVFSLLWGAVVRLERHVQQQDINDAAADAR